MKIFLICFVVGIFAQMVDGTLGMAYGVSCNTFLRELGIPTAMASASVHFAEMFTTLASGISHLKMKNITKKLFLGLLIPGVIGGILGAYILSNFYNEIFDPIIDGYLIIMGLIILSKLFRKEKKTRDPGAYIYPLGFAGGFLDAVGGGGWGPVVTSTLVASGHDVKKTIGSVNTAEFFVTIAESATFIISLRASFLDNLYAVLGLIIGGVIAAPIAAWLCKKIPVKPLLAFVGLLIVGLNTYSLITFFIK